MRFTVLCLVLLGVSGAQSAADMEAIQDSLSVIGERAVLVYEELFADSFVTGTVTVTFTVSRDGFVSGVGTEFDEPLEPVARVIRDAVSALRFGPLSQRETPMEVSVPYDFFPAAQ